jgi:hypothetical protein
MAFCSTCGGELGRECFDPGECAQHASDIAAHYADKSMPRRDLLKRSTGDRTPVEQAEDERRVLRQEREEAARRLSL